MNLRKTEKHEPLAPGRRLAGKKTPRLSVEGRVFLLTSPFIERAYRTSLTMSALSNPFWADLSIHLKEFFLPLPGWSFLSAWTYFKRLWRFGLLERRSSGKGTLEYKISDGGTARLRWLRSKRGR